MDLNKLPRLKTTRGVFTALQMEGRKKSRSYVAHSLKSSSSSARRRQTGLPDAKGCYHSDRSGTSLKRSVYTDYSQRRLWVRNEHNTSSFSENSS